MSEEHDDDLESFYVYRSLHSDESWGTVLSETATDRLPNISFGMRVFARNEREAVARARDLYERYYKRKKKEDLIFDLASHTIQPVVLKSIDGTNFNESIMRNVAKLILKFSEIMGEEYDKYVKEMRDEQNISDTVRSSGERKEHSGGTTVEET